MKNQTIPRHGEIDALMLDDFGNECREVRKLPYGGPGNILCGKAGYDREMTFRRERIKAGVPFDLPSWESLKVYFPAKS